MWGKELKDEKDVWNVFYSYLTGEVNKDGVKVSRRKGQWKIVRHNKCFIAEHY
jgi:hypothetical protein